MVLVREPRAALASLVRACDGDAALVARYHGWNALRSLHARLRLPPPILNAEWFCR